MLTTDQKQFIKNNYQSMIYRDIAVSLGVTESMVCNYLYKNNLRLSADEISKRRLIGEFKKGQISWNKGISYQPKANAGQFVKGALPHNTLCDGAIRLRKRPHRINQDYYFIRVALGKWKMYHVYLWEQANGPLPKGCIVRFKDHNHLNCALDNLEMIDRVKLMDLNRNYNHDRMKSDKVISFYITRDPELRKNLLKHPEIIELKRQQLKLESELNEAKRQAV